MPEKCYQAYSDWMERRYGFPLKKEWLRFTTGCVTAIAWMVQAFTKPGEPCLILTPVYYPFHNVVTYNDRRLVTVDLHYEEGRFTLDYDAIEKAILVVSDEIHQDLVLTGRRFVPVAVVNGGAYRDMAVTLSSASKTFSLATLIHAHIIIITDDKLREIFDHWARGHEPDGEQRAGAGGRLGGLHLRRGLALRPAGGHPGQLRV